MVGGEDDSRFAMTSIINGAASTQASPRLSGSHPGSPCHDPPADCQMPITSCLVASQKKPCRKLHDEQGSGSVSAHVAIDVKLW